MKRLIFLASLGFMLAMEWIAIVETGLFGQIAGPPLAVLAEAQASIDTADPAVFLFAVAKVAVASLSVIVLLICCVCTAINVAKIFVSSMSSALNAEEGRIFCIQLSQLVKKTPPEGDQ